jgi:hypothetical protein
VWCRQRGRCTFEQTLSEIIRGMQVQLLQTPSLEFFPHSLHLGCILSKCKFILLPIKRISMQIVLDFYFCIFCFG